MKIRVELEVDVEPYTRDEMLESGVSEEALDDDAENGVTDDQVDVQGVASCIASFAGSDEGEMFAGSGIFVHLKNVRLVEAEPI